MMTAMTQSSSVAITHAYVVPVSAEPIENGTVDSITGEPLGQ